MNQILFCLNEYANLITATATLALALLTIALVLENRMLRKSGSSPEVVVYLTPHPDGNGGIHFVLANVGRGPAFNISFTLNYDDNDFTQHNAFLSNDPERQPITVLPQDEKIRALLGVSFQLYGLIEDKDIGPLKPFAVSIIYYDVFGIKFARERIIDITQFAGLAGILEKSNERKIVESLENIGKNIAAIGKQASRFSAFVDTTKIGERHVQKAKGNPPQADE